MAVNSLKEEVTLLIFTSFYGLGISTVSALSVSFAAKRMNVSGYYTWVFFFAKNLLPMFNPVLCSYLMEQDIEYFILMNLATTALALILVPVMAYIPVEGSYSSREELEDSSDEDKTTL